VYVVEVARPLEGIEGIKGVEESKRIEGIEAIVRTSLAILPLGLEVTTFTRNLLRKFTSRARYAFNYLFRSYKSGRRNNLLAGFRVPSLYLILKSNTKSSSSYLACRYNSFGFVKR
jgi:hypothetical protein